MDRSEPGHYSIQYQLCDLNTPANCATATDSITVNADIVATSETGSAVSGHASTPIANVVANDTVNGMTVALGSGGNAVIAAVGFYPSGITLNISTGTITTTAAVQPGVYTLGYQLCDLNSPANCDNATSTITVAADIVAVVETGNSISGTASTPILNVAANDTVNGASAVLGVSGNATVSAVGSYPAGISLNVNTGAISTTSALQP